MSDFTFNTIVAFILVCTALNICWWLYGRTLSEVFPAPVVVTVMLTTLFCFFVAFKLLFMEVCGNFLSPRWGYMTDYGEFVPYAKDIAYILAGILTAGIAVLLYKHEGKMADSKYRSADEEEGRNPERQSSGKESSGGTRRSLGKI